MPTLRERFAVDVSQRDRAIEHLKAEGYAVLEAQDGGGDFGRDGEPWAVIVVESADDVEVVTHQTQHTFAAAVGDLLTRGDFRWRLVPRPNRYRDILTPSGWVRALQRRRL